MLGKYVSLPKSTGPGTIRDPLTGGGRGERASECLVWER